MNHAAGLENLVGTHEGGPIFANLEDVAARNIIVVEEIALKIQGLTFSSKDKSQVYNIIVEITICF